MHSDVERRKEEKREEGATKDYIVPFGIFVFGNKLQIHPEAELRIELKARVRERARE